jgi:hypothetical protein
MADNNDDGDDGTVHKPTAREYIVHHLVKFGRATVHEMATSPIHSGYSHSHIRKTAVDLWNEGVIEGERTTEILSCEINGMWIILDSNRARIVRELQQCAPHLASQAQGMILDDIHNLVQNNADQIGTLGEKWEFWVDPATLTSSSQRQVRTQADDVEAEEE